MATMPGWSWQRDSDRRNRPRHAAHSGLTVLVATGEAASRCVCTAPVGTGYRARMIDYWPLLGVAVVVAGFALKRNPAMVVVTAGLVSGFAAGRSPGELLTLLGTAFVNNRTLLLFAV